MASALFSITCVTVFVVLVAVTSVGSQSLRAGLGYYCTNYSQCANTTPNSYCQGTTCQCQPGYLQISSSKCSLALGYRCTNNTQCQVSYSYCNSYNYTCSCLAGYKQYNTTSCIWGGVGPVPTTTPRPTVSCNTVGCASYGPGAFCNTGNGYCYCTSGYILDRNYCYYKIEKVGDTCNANTQICYLSKTGSKGVECSSNKCKCMKGYKASKDNRACNSATTLMTATSVTILMLVSWALR